MVVNDHEAGDLYFQRFRKASLHERLLAHLADGTAQDHLEAQELRQSVHQALRELTPEELRVIELRYQHKRSPGQVASWLRIAPDAAQELERSGLDKLRAYLEARRAGE